MFPRQADVCDRCNGAVFLIKEGLDAGLAAGRLRIPEGLPMLWNVEDFSQCPDTVRLAPAGAQRGGARRCRGLACFGALASEFCGAGGLRSRLAHL